MPGSTHPRVVVVGAGHNGLVCALHLAAAGLDVTVLEHAPNPGGATSTTETTLPGFRFDHCAGFLPMTKASPAFAELALEEDGLTWVAPEIAMAHPFDDGSAIALHRAIEPTAASLEAVQPGAGRAWAELAGRTAPHADRLARTVLGPLPPVRDPLALALAWRRDGVELVRRGAGSVEALGLDVFEDATRPSAWLAGTAQHSGLPPEAAGSGLFALVLQLLAHAHSWPFPRGGVGTIADLLVARLERAGGRVRCDAHVEAILTRSGRVAGVRLGSGEEVAAEVVVTTVSAGVLHGMLPDDALPGHLMRVLRRWRYGTGVFRLDYALDAPVPWPSAEARAAGVVQVGGELQELAKAAQEGHRGVVPERPALVVGQHSLHDPTRAPEGRHTLWVYAHVPSRYDGPDDEVAGRIEAQLDRFAPGFSSHVLARHARPPWRTEQENPSLVGGDLAGGVYELDQLLVFRPAPELSRSRTPLRGLYVAGASVHPGGAVQGMSGRGAARAVLADRAPLRLGRLRYAGKGSAARVGV
jgi:phytoene dehydrogenase-like protein